MWSWILVALAACALAEGAGAGAGRLVCYVGGGSGGGGGGGGYAECTHLVYAGDARGGKLDALLKDFRKQNPRVKILVRAAEVDEDLRSLLKSKHVQGLELRDAHRTLDRARVQELVSSARSALAAAGGGPLLLSLPANPELLAKYYDLRRLVKTADLVILETDELGAASRTTYHPSRLSGMWDMMNTDSVVDLVVGLGVPASKVVISLPATARQFTLANETLSTPGSPAEDEEPKILDQKELCRMLQKGRWTLERDQDLSAPYAFQNKTWIAFEDSSSVDVKGKYARVRGLAGLALADADRDSGTACGGSLRGLLSKVLNQQSRAPRAVVLRSLEQEILAAPHARALDALQLSPYRITQVVDADGVIHSVREDSRTEFSCSRQGYFVHPRSCGRFYRCVKFDQTSPDYTVFEFDCPAGLEFDARYEVCVWPGSLAAGRACAGSAEIAPVPEQRFVCPETEGYYADPENCRWFFACLDHGAAPLTAYEFRCPFGLGFDAARLRCDWPWLVPACGGIARYEAQAFGFGSARLTGSSAYHGQTADAINVAAHQSLVSGAALDNHVGTLHHLTQNDALNNNFIASQELANSLYKDSQNSGLSHPTKYTSGSLILDEFRQPAHKGTQQINGLNLAAHNLNQHYQANYEQENSGAYVHDPSGDYAEPYRHLDAPAAPYVHDGSLYKDGNKYQDYQYKSTDYDGKYGDNSGQYVHDISGAYVGEDNGYGKYRYQNQGAYVAGAIQSAGQSNLFNADSYSGGNVQNYHEYSANNGNYVTGTNAYTGGSHTLAAGSVNVGLVGKTSLVDAGYKQGYVQNAYSSQTVHGNDNAHLSYVSQPAVSISHLGTDAHNHDGYEYATVQTSSVIPTTATPFAATAAPTYRTTFVPQPPVSTVKQIFYQEPGVTVVKPTFVPVTQNVTPKIQITGHNYEENSEISGYDYSKPQVSGYEYSKPQVSGYDYSRPAIKFEEGITYTTPKPLLEIAKQNPQGFSHSVQHGSEFGGYDYSTRTPVVEQPFVKALAYTTTAPTISVATESTYTPQTFSQETVHQVDAAQVDSGYNYNSGVSYQPPQIIEYNNVKPIPAVSSQQTYSHQTLHQINTAQTDQGYKYEQPQIVEYNTVKPIQSVSVDQSYNHQTVHQVDTSQIQNYDESAGYDYSRPAVKFVEAPKTVVQVTTPQPIVSTYKPHQYEQQHIVEYNTVKPIQSGYIDQSYNHHTIHQVDSTQIKNYDESAGYDYSRPAVKFLEAPKTIVQVTTPQPIVPVYKSYNVPQLVPISTSAPNVQIQYQQSPVTVYENPILKYTQKATPVTYVQPTPAIITPTNHPTVIGHELKQSFVPLESAKQSYNNIQYNQAGYTYNQPEIQRDIEYNSGNAYSLASDVSHQSFQQTHVKIDHGSENNNIQFISTTPATLAYEDSYLEYEAPKKVEFYKAPEYVHPETEKPRYISSTPATFVQESYNHEIQDNYDYKQSDFEQNDKGVNQQGVVANQVSFGTSYGQAKPVESYHISSLPGSTVRYTPALTPEIQDGYKAEEYLPPVVSTPRPVVSSRRPIVTTTYVPRTSTTPREYLPPAPEPTYSVPEYLPPKDEAIFYTPSTTAKPVTTTYRPVTTTYRPVTTYKPVSTTFQAPEYLPPLEESDKNVVNFESFGLRNVDDSKIKYNPYQEYESHSYSSTSAPLKRKQNIVVQTAKSNQLGFGTVGPDAGLVSAVTYSSTPVSSTETYVTPNIVSSTPNVIQGLVEINPSPIPARRVKPKVAVVTKINDYNPFLVRKLGAVCSCQRPIVVVRGRRPDSVQKDYDVDFNDYEDSGRGDVDIQYEKQNTNGRIKAAPVTSTFNPIIVPDDSYYQDIPSDSNVDITPKTIHSENYVSSTPTISTERPLRIRSRVKAVTVAPTYQTVLTEISTPVGVVAEKGISSADSQAFDRYGPGGWRSRDETLQGSIDCQRAGLFRHPKQCNKFYACRWDCTKQRFTLHVFNCPVQLSFDPKLGACNWPSQGPACQGDTLLTNNV